MKRITKLFGIVALTVVILFSMTTCSDDPLGDKGENPYKGEILLVADEQVWEHTDVNRIKGAYKISLENGYINIYSPENDIMDVGPITAGKLSFTLGKPEKLYEISNPVFDKVFHEWWDDAAVAEGSGTIKGNTVLSMWFHGDDGMYGLMFREKLVGTGTSIALEDIVFIYVDGDCRIKGNSKSGMVPGTGYFASQDLDLTLKQGWNMVCRKMLYGSEEIGINVISMELKNLVDFKWAIWEYHE